MEHTAYIDGANLYMGIQSLGNDLDYNKFRQWLFWKYRITKAYIFLGYIESHTRLYQHLQASGFEIIFKESVRQAGGIKANVDAELVLQVARDAYENKLKQAIIVSGDGDFSCLIDFLHAKHLLKTMIAPNRKYCSYLLRKKNLPLLYLDDVIAKIRKDPR